MVSFTDLRHVGSAELDTLLTEETAEWRDEADWDFAPTADSIRGFADQRALGGCALRDASEDLSAYGYTVVEDDRGIIGDMYVRKPWRGQNVERGLFRALLDDLIAVPQVRRIETQLMLVEPALVESFARERFVRLFERVLMRYDLSVPLPEGRRYQAHRFQIEPWSLAHMDAASALMVLAYDGHVDAQINDLYRTLAGASAFLTSLTALSGCGNFHPAASFAAVDRVTGWLAGILLTSFVAPGVAHLTQVCVSPRARSAGLGYELLRRAAAALADTPARRITLTVTVANASAHNLYLNCGFAEARRFYACVWERHGH